MPTELETSKCSRKSQCDDRRGGADEVEDEVRRAYVPEKESRGVREGKEGEE